MQNAEVDVVVITKNSERILRKCLNSVYVNLPVKTLIIVDGYSTDKTLSIVDDFQKKYGNVLLILDKGNRATARQKGLDKVSTDWFVFVDSDVVLCDGWFEKAQKYVQEDVGAIWGIEVWSTIRDLSVLKIFLWLTRKIFEVRGGTHDTLVRRDSIVGMRIPSNLHVFEDAYIKDWIEKKGWKVVACYNPFCIHHRAQDVYTLKGSIEILAEVFRYGSLRLLGRLFFLSGFYVAYVTYQFLSNK